MTAEGGPDGRHDRDDGRGDADVVESLPRHRLLDHGAPVEAQTAVGRHQDDRRGRGDLLGDAEQQGQHAEAAYVQATAGERREESTYDTCDEQSEGLQWGEVVDRVVGLSLVVAVQEEQGEGEREPDGDEAHLLLDARQPYVDRVEAAQGAQGAAREAEHDGVPLDLYTLQHHGHGGRGHATRLHHERHVSRHRRRRLQR